MAKPTTTIPPRGKGGRLPSYPWEEWLDGSVWEIIQGEDFDSKISSFVVTIRQAAKRHGLKVTLTTQDDRIFLQAYSPE